MVDASTLQVNRVIPQATRGIEGTCITWHASFILYVYM